MPRLHRLRLLHLSDLHERIALPWMSEERRRLIALRASERRRVLIESNFAEVLTDIRRSGAIDMVCFTGDVADWGLAGEYELATARIDEILHCCGVGRERLFVVPGNHDVARLSEAAAWQEVRKRGFSERGLSDWWAGLAPPSGAQPGWRDAVMTRTAAFWDWVGAGLGRRELLPAGSLHERLGYHARFERSGLPFEVHVVGLDSAWLCGDDNDARKIRLTEGQIRRLTRDREGAPLRGFRLALVHHPLTDLTDEKTSKRLLAETTDLLLHGHQHEALAEVMEDPDRQLRVIAAGSLYEGDEGDKWINSFNLIDVDFDSNGRPAEYTVTFWAWSARGHWHRSGEMYREARDGVLKIAVPRPVARPSGPVALEPSSATAIGLPETHVFIGESGCTELGPGRAALAWIAIDDVPRLRRQLGSAVDDWVHHRAISSEAKERLPRTGFQLPDDDLPTREKMIEVLTVAEISGYVSVAARRPGEPPNDLRRRLLGALLRDRLRKRGSVLAAVYVRPAYDRAALAASLEEAAAAVPSAKVPAIRIEQRGPDSPLSAADYLAAIVARRLDDAKGDDPLARAFDRVRAKAAYVWDADATTAYHRTHPLP
jgi:predicted phosphodiesterase